MVVCQFVMGVMIVVLLVQIQLRNITEINKSLKMVPYFEFFINQI